MKTIFLVVTAPVLIMALFPNYANAGDIQTSVQIPLYFGLHDDYKSNGPTLVRVSDDQNRIVFQHTGEWKHWGGSTLADTLTAPGKYVVTVTYYPDSVSTQSLRQEFELNGKETHIDLTVQLATHLNGFNEIVVHKYLGNELNLLLKRKWDPQTQFEQDTSMLPDYDLVNTSDSTIYGIYHRFSSSVSISWIQLHYITHMGHQRFNEGRWEYISCNAPRINTDIKPGETGETLKDMVLDCGKKNYERGGKYRVVVEYGINNAVINREEPTEESPLNVFVEAYIYQIFDEYELSSRRGSRLASLSYYPASGWRNQTARRR